MRKHTIMLLMPICSLILCSCNKLNDDSNSSSLNTITSLSESITESQSESETETESVSVSQTESQSAADAQTTDENDMPFVATDILYFCGYGKTLESPFEHDSETTPEFMLQKLAEASGINLDASSIQTNDDSITINFSSSAYFFSGDIQSDRLTNLGFEFYDVETVEWFILDSINTTFKNTFAIEHIYFTHDGNEFYDENSGIRLPLNQEYLGSNSYQ